MTDGAALGLLLGSAASGRDSAALGLGLASLATYAMGGPIVHAANGLPGKAGISLLLRVGAPFVLGGLGFEAGARRTSDSYPLGVWGELGAFVGIAGAVALDASVLARKIPSVEPRVGAIRLAPSFAPTRGGGTLGAVGWF